MSLVVAAALAIVLVMRRRSAALRHWILSAAIMCAALVPVLSLAVPAWHLPLIASQSKTSSALTADPGASAPIAGIDRSARTEAAVDARSGSALSSGQSSTATWRSRLTTPLVIGIIWLAGAVFMILILVAGLA